MKNQLKLFTYMTKPLVLFVLLFALGVGQMWGDEITVYVTGEIFAGTGDDAWDNSTSTIKVDIRKGHPECFECDNNDFNGVKNVDMTNTGYTYNGYPIYSYTLNQGGAQWRFKHYKNGDWKEDYTTEWHSTTGQIYRGHWSDEHHWITYGRDVTFYATPEKMDGSKWEEGTHSLFANFKYGDGESEWKRQQMTKTAYTYNGDAIYTCTMLLPYNVIKNVQFLYNDGSDHELYVYTPSPQLTANDVDGKVFRGYISSAHTWAAYGRDVTIYTIPDYLFKDKGTPYNESIHYPAVCIQMGTGSTWNTENLTKTAYTYDSYPIYKATILIDQNKFWEYQIKYFKKSDNTQVDLYQFNQSEPKAEYAPSYIDDKLYHGWNEVSHDFFSYRYDVALDMQSGGGGSTSIIAIDGSAMPSATMPGRDGYAFGGYWTETNGGGTQYYDAEGASTRNWDSRTITTLYAKWTARNYTVNLEDPPATTAVTVTFDAALSAITPPTKTYYTFDGYWTDNDNAGATLVDQLIDKDGNWKKDIDPYTGLSGDDATWIYPNGKSLFAKWNEDLHTVGVTVSPEGAGFIQISDEEVTSLENIGYATHSDEMTADSINALWTFKQWQVSSDAHLDLENYSNTGRKMKVTATADEQTVTAVFQHRYNLLGSKFEEKDKADMATGGMPGWNYGNGADFTINSYPGDGDDVTVELVYTCDLDEGTYIFEIHDRATGKSLGRKNGSAIYQLEDGASVELRDGTDQNESVFFYPQTAGEYTFKITHMRKNGVNYYPTVTIERPHQVFFGQKYLDIDGTLREGTTGGSASVKVGETAKTSGDYVNYNTSVTHDIDEVTGYHFAGWWGSDEYVGARFSNVHPMTYAVTSDDHAFAKFTEDSTHVHFANDGHGHVEIGGVTRTDTIVGITTHRKIVGVPDVGYKFSSWAKTSCSDYDIDDLSSDTATLSGNGGGATSGQTVTANFTYRYSIKGTMNDENWGTTHTLSNIGTNASSKDTCYVTMTLPANTTYEFAIYDEQTKGWLKNSTSEVFKMIYGNSSAWPFDTDKTVNCGITTAGKGTYKFIFNITDKTVTVVYPTSYQVNYGASPSVGGNITVVDDDSQAVPNGGYVRSGGRVTFTAAANTYYTFVGWCNNDSYGDTFNTELSWTNSNVTETQNSFAKFKSTNFVIYRTGDMEDDPRAAYDDVESFDGGTISEVIELRMKVHELDKWYSLYLPYNVDSVCVYDVDEAKYYKMQPYFRKTLGGKLYAGHYIIRKPELTNDSIALANFGDWRDPSTSTFTPSGNTPYIIQWHNSYFEGKYVSFFGAAGQSIDSSFSEGEAPKTKNWVTVHGNNSMKSGSVVDAYTLDGDEIWVRPVDKGESVAILPFECYIRANSEVTNKYLVLRRGMNTDDTPTGWESVSIPSEKASKVLMDGQLYIIRGNQIYTIQGALVK